MQSGIFKRDETLEKFQEMGLIQKVNINYLLPKMENEFKITGPNCTKQSSRLLWGTFAKRCNYVFGMIAIILSSPPQLPTFWRKDPTSTPDAQRTLQIR